MVLDLNTQGTIGCTPNSVPHGILGDEKTHKYPQAIGRFYRDFSFSGGPCWWPGVHPTNSPE